ncbi:MAG: helix-turn-helix transcriptional regulator [Colwellia sp.]|nr:helix-turn-helix transcriptional regulator [Colwellia sp.]
MTTRHNKSANVLINEQANSQVVARVEKMPKDYLDKWHKHPWHQLVFPFEGILQTKVADNQYVIPHTGMLFIPANTNHESFVMTDTKFIGIYLNPESDIHYPQRTQAISVTPFLRELILHIKQLAACSNTAKGEIKNLLKVLSDQICAGDSYSMTLLLPSDRRLMVIFKALMLQPQRDTTLADWAKEVGASQRTLSRLFIKELGMSFPLWRQHLRLVSSLGLLAANLSVQEVAFNVGYNSDSSFIYAFKSLFSQTPQQYRRSGFKLSSRIKAISES